MQVYVVGGAVRDELLGLPVKDCDYVVVGSTPEAMVKLGFKPVGKDFPVFLHPQTQEEYALARTERKTAPGYAGFAFHADASVTLEDDLARRDLTINAMARLVDVAGEVKAAGLPVRIIDPYGGQADLQAKIFRHVGAAFVEDPVRILRLARFAARFGDFTVAPETMALMRTMVANGEVDALVPERVWQEFAKGLGEAHPVRLFEVLREAGALERVAPELAAVALDDAGWTALRHAADRNLSLPARIAALLHTQSAEAIQALAERIRMPSDARDLALVLARTQATFLQAATLSAADLVDLFQSADALRQRERFFALVAATHCIAKTQCHDFTAAVKRLNHTLAAAKAVDGGAVARAHPTDIPAQLRLARIAAVAVVAAVALTAQL